MDMQAKEAALGIAERGGAARAAAGSGSRLAAALGVLDRQNNAKQQHAKFKAKADTDADADANVEDSSEAPKEGVEIKRESEEDEIKPKFRHIDISALEGRKGDDTNECQENCHEKRGVPKKHQQHGVRRRGRSEAEKRMYQIRLIRTLAQSLNQSPNQTKMKTKMKTKMTTTTRTPTLR